MTTTKTPSTTSATEPVEKPETEAPVLRVSTEPKPKPTVEIDDKLYELRVLPDFGIGRQQALSRDGREFNRLWFSDDELSEDQQKRLKFLLERLYGEILDAPKSVLRKLSDADKADVVLTFSYAPLRKLMEQALQTQQQQQNMEAGDGASISTS